VPSKDRPAERTELPDEEKQRRMIASGKSIPSKSSKEGQDGFPDQRETGTASKDPSPILVPQIESYRHRETAT
jgi:hypothetical protein